MPRRRKTSRALSRAKARGFAVALAPGPVERRYVASLRALSRALASEYLRRLEPVLASVARRDGGVREDALSEVSRVLDVAGLELHVQIPNLVGPLFSRMSADLRKKNGRAFDLIKVKSNDLGISAEIEAARDRSIRMVENAHRVYAADVREIMEDPETFGLRVEEIKEKLLTRGQVSESRAELLARDQTLKLNGAIAQTRMQQSGIESYTWSTSQDDRVREEHRALEGQTFTWLSPPDVGHPGQDFQCRCVAIPIVEELAGLFDE